MFHCWQGLQSEIEGRPGILRDSYLAASAVGDAGCMEAFCCCQH